MSRSIGTLGEKTLHAVLKRYCEPDAAFHEARCGPYVADVLREGRIFEIQTRQFSKLREKLRYYLPGYDVTVVYPVAAVKWLCRVSAAGEVLSRRKSPRAGRAWDILPELYAIKMFLGEGNLHFLVLLLEVEELRPEGRKRGGDRVPLSVVSEVSVQGRGDYPLLLPPGLPEAFTSRDFARCARRPLAHAQSCLNVLHHVGAVRRVGRGAQGYVYRIGE